jgi:hypothetical protein
MGWFSRATGGIFDPISEPLADVEDTVRDELSGLDDFVNENVPGGWAGVILIAGGIYYAPEIGAYISADGAVVGSTQGLTAEQIAVANASADPIAAANELAAWTQTQTAAAEAAAVQAAADTAAAEAAAAEAAAVVTPETITSEIAAGNADKAALYSNAGYGDAMTSAQITAYDKAIASGMTVSDALNYARAGLFVNAITGDPLGLSGNTGGGGGAGFAGFEQVPIPADWRSPTYAASAAPIDLSSIFTDQNLLAGTQWQGLPQQQNVSFNDIFASGQQQTPMGNMVDINQIVSAILGQNTASQKLT